MQIRQKFFHLDETCPIFKHLKEGETCFFKKTCDALCNLNDGTAEYRTMRRELDFRVFPEAWLSREKETLVQVAKVISQLEQRNMLVEAKRLKSAYGFDVSKRIKLPE